MTFFFLQFMEQIFLQEMHLIDIFEIKNSLKLEKITTGKEKKDFKFVQNSV